MASAISRAICSWSVSGGLGRLRIGEPCEGFCSGGFLAGWGALGGVALYEWVHSEEYYIGI
jgi:hypothetical protein